MFLISAVVVLTVFACSVSNNDPITSLNPDCNDAGVCKAIPGTPIEFCSCCAPQEQHPGNVCGDYWVCDPLNPDPFCYAFTGIECTVVKQYYWVNFGFRSGDTDPSSPSDVYCNTDPYERFVNKTFLYPSVSMEDQVTQVVVDLGMNVFVHEAPCDTCSETYPCTVGIAADVNATSGSTFAYQIVLNEFYDPFCYAEGIVLSVEDLPDCAANYDYGQLAYTKWEGVNVLDSNKESIFLQNLNRLLEAAPDASNDFLGLGFTNTRMLRFSAQAPHTDLDYIRFPTTESPTQNPTPLPTHIPSPSPTTMPTPVPTGSPTVSPTPVPTDSPTESPTEMPTPVPTESPTVSPTPVPTDSPTESPTPVPTESPTVSPTPMPTQTPTYECGPYSNDVADLSFIGVGSNCRGGLNSSYPGNLTCASPYVICLPQENTPAALGDQDYKNSTHRYSVDECLQECANDQRCSGIEFVADSSSSLGDCNLIDDIPVVITSTVNTTFEYESTIMYTNLDNSTTGGEALCFQKEDYCNPYFEAEDLTDDMLDCYCPNNRKGFYTKKVKRTVENSRFCGNDTEVELRIQKAQANRMFHLCENWCLFLTEDPAAESWYYDPWKACFREQYASGDDHRAYCNRVIRDPNTIEIQFIYNRVRLSCNATNNGTNGTVEGY